MAKLTSDIQTFIVERLACFKTPQQVADLVKDEFGVTIDRRQVEHYDPTKGQKKPARQWVTLFSETRKAFKERTRDIAIAIESYRLQELMDLYLRAVKMGNLVLAASLLEQAAREAGGAYTNRRVLEGDPEKPLQLNHRRDELRDLSPEQLASLYRDVLTGHG